MNFQIDPFPYAPILIVAALSLAVVTIPFAIIDIRRGRAAKRLLAHVATEPIVTVLWPVRVTKFGDKRRRTRNHTELLRVTTGPIETLTFEQQ